MVELCELCKKRPWLPQQCPGDEARHGHGGIHCLDADRLSIGLHWVCGECYREQLEHWGRPNDAA